MNRNREVQAVTQLRSWFSAAGIPPASSSPDGADLSILTSEGSELPIVVLAENDGRAVPPGWVGIKATEITGRQLGLAIEKFKDITESAGHGRLEPVSRGPIPKGNLRFDEDFELVAMRHKELRRAPNPASAEDIEKYRPILEKICWNFIKSPFMEPLTNARLCFAAGMDHDDLMSYAMLYTTAWISLHDSNDLQPGEKKALLTLHVKQKLHQLRGILVRKMRNCCSAIPTEMYLPGRKPMFDEQDPIDIDETASFVEYKIRDNHPEVRGPGKIAGKMADRLIDIFANPLTPKIRASQRRRKSAKKILAEKLSAMPCGKLVPTLAKAMKSEDKDVQGRAAVLLGLHQIACKNCLD